MATMHLGERSGAGRWALTGAIMGVAAGIIFAAFEVIMAAILGDGFFMPLRMIGAVVLGEGALGATYSLAAAVIMGLVVHLVLSAIYGAVFGLVVFSVHTLQRRGWLIGAATVFGFALWIVNFYLIAPFAFPWFTEANVIVQFLAHTFFFGTALGLLMERMEDD